MSIRKFLLVPLVLIALVSGLADSFHFEEKELATERSLWKLYERWSEHHAISRPRNQKLRRFNVFKMNAKRVFKVNQMNKPYTLKLNQFADMSNREFVKLYAGANITHYSDLYNKGKEKDNAGEFMYATTVAPPSLDWRALGAVAPVKDQKQCNGCWAFAVTGAVESMHQIRTKQLISLSEQELIDCDYMSRGCNGGYMNSAFDFIRQNGGITSEANYPFINTGGVCRSSSMTTPEVMVGGYVMVPPNEDALMQAVANQPVTVGWAGGTFGFQFFGGGVFDGECGPSLNHALVVVGYGTTADGTDYWIARNSWGSSWGEGGYARIKRGLEPPTGHCGIASQASYPV